MMPVSGAKCCVQRATLIPADQHVSLPFAGQRSLLVRGDIFGGMESGASRGGEIESC